MCGRDAGAAPSAGRILPIHFAMRNRAGKTVMVLGKSFRESDSGESGPDFARVPRNYAGLGPGASQPDALRACGVGITDA